jgi:hypothetical protein
MKLNRLTIQIGPIAFTVKETRGLRDEDDHTKLLGQIRYDDQVIDLEAKQGLDAKRVTLIHEILHGIFFNAGLRDHDEQIIDIVATGLLDLLRQNPHLLAALGIPLTRAPQAGAPKE